MHLCLFCEIERKCSKLFVASHFAFTIFAMNFEAIAEVPDRISEVASCGCTNKVKCWYRRLCFVNPIKPKNSFMKEIMHCIFCTRCHDSLKIS